MADSGRAHARENFPGPLLPVSLSPRWNRATTRLCRRPPNTSRRTTFAQGVGILPWLLLILAAWQLSRTKAEREEEHEVSRLDYMKSLNYALLYSISTFSNTSATIMFVVLFFPQIKKWSTVIILFIFWPVKYICYIYLLYSYIPFYFLCRKVSMYVKQKLLYSLTEI